METCVRCGKSDESVTLLDGIYGNEVVKICEPCSKIEGALIISKPTQDQLKATQRNKTVYERLKSSSGYRPPVRDQSTINTDYEKMRVSSSGKTMDSLRRNLAKDQVKTSASQLGLVNNYHWVLMTARRKSGLTPRQLGERIGESELTIKMVERSEMPDNASSVISKIESYLGIRLRAGASDSMKYARSPVMVGDANVGINPNMMTVGDLKTFKEGEGEEVKEKKKGIFSKMRGWFGGSSEEEKKEEKTEDKKGSDEEE